MARVIVHEPKKVTVRIAGYTGTPTGDIELTENNRTYNVSSFATATTAIPEEEKTVTPSTAEQVVSPDNGLLKKVTVYPTPLEEKTVAPTTEQKTYTPQSPAIGFSQFTVEPMSAPPVLIEKIITENGTYSAEDDNADGYDVVDVNVPLPSIKLADIHPEQVTNSLDMYIENVANPDDNHILIIMCNEYNRLTPQSNYALFLNMSQVITVNGIRSAVITNAMLRPNGTIGIGTPAMTFSNHNFHWNDAYAYLFPGYTYSIYLINLGNNSSTPQRNFVDEAPQKAAAFDFFGVDYDE